MIEDKYKIKFGSGESVYSSQITFITGIINEADIKKISDSLYNPLIQRVIVKTHNDFIKTKGMGISIPKVIIATQAKVDSVNLNIPDEELITIGKKGIQNKDGSYRGPLALDLDSMKTIRDYFKKQKRNPTDIELESIAQTWSEHCKHTIFANPIDELKDGLYKTYIKGETEIIRKKKGKKDFCASVFTDNSGGIIFDENYLITDNVETHNTPSALDPFGGAVTGIVGVNRDALGFGMGAKPIINRYGFCFANPDNTTPIYKGQNMTQKMLSPKRGMQGVIVDKFWRKLFRNT
jgi:phosphoribosylformylglycinamidine synthase